MSELLVLEVVTADLDRPARGFKLAADRLEIADQLALLRVHADHRLTRRERRADRLGDVLKLRVTIGMLRASRVFLFACRLYPLAFNSRRTVRSTTSCPSHAVLRRASRRSAMSTAAAIPDHPLVTGSTERLQILREPRLALKDRPKDFLDSIDGDDGQDEVRCTPWSSPNTEAETRKAMTTTDTLSLPDYAPVPRSAIGPALNEQGYYVGRVERNLYWVTDGTYQSAFLTTSDGVVVFDAPPTIGHNIQRAVDDIAAANGVSNQVNYLIYSHHHSDHAGASSLFGKNVTRIGHEETRRLLLRDDDPARPPNEETFADHRTLEIGGERIDLAWHGANHSPDNIIIHLPDHDTLMLIDIVNPGWAPIYLSNLTEDIPGYIEAPANALAYSWKHFIGGHNGRLGTREDVTLHQRYMADIAENSRKAIDTVDPTRYFVKYGENVWAALKGYLDEITHTAAAPVIERYTDVLAAADVFTESTTFQVMQSIRLDLGYGSQVHP